MESATGIDGQAAKSVRFDFCKQSPRATVRSRGRHFPDDLPGRLESVRIMRGNLENLPRRNQLNTIPKIARHYSTNGRWSQCVAAIRDRARCMSVAQPMTPGQTSTLGQTSSRKTESAFRIELKALMLQLAVLVLLSTGCASPQYLVRRGSPANPLAVQLQISSRTGPTISDRSAGVLRRYALEDLYKTDANQCLETMQSLMRVESDGELVYSVSELAYVQAQRAERNRKPTQALDLYGVAVSNAYMYLFSLEFDAIRNPYDPIFRGACDLYNQSLESLLRIVDANGQLRPGTSYEVTSEKENYRVATVMRGQWSQEDFDHFEFVSDYQLQGLTSSGLSYGLGVPLIAVRKKGSQDDPREAYYPKGLSFPVTALLRVVPRQAEDSEDCNRHHCVLELHDPLVSTDIDLAGRLVPLQTDLSAALAYFLDNPEFREQNRATIGLINSQKADSYRGILMLEPFDPTRIPVLMVHGLWSSPVTWMPMFNDLRSFSELRQNYQFWFYHYPTGQPVWLSATQMREELQTLRDRLDPDRQYEALNQMVLVGHSMGGLLSRMQTIDSRDDFWQILSEQPFDQVQGSPEDIGLLKKAAFFEPSREIRRVVTIGTPHRGSDYANDLTRWLGRRFIRLPTIMVSTGQKLISHNPGVFRNTELLTTSTSIDSLSPKSPLFPAMLRAPRAPWVTYHNVIGMVPPSKWSSKPSMNGDGIVDYESARMDDVESEIVVSAEHSEIHRNPQTILEVRRILLQHLDAVQAEYRVAQRLASLKEFKPAVIGVMDAIPASPANSRGKATLAPSGSIE
jgi:pimeloyl-ACP methyl ester carboxylesterase